MSYLLKLLLFIKNKKRINTLIILLFILIIIFSLAVMQLANNNPFIYFQF
jgi:hypothetical protein